MPVIGEKPRPRALAIGFDVKQVGKFKEFFPTLRAVGRLEEVREAEWDVVVANQVNISPEPHLYVLSFGTGLVGGVACSGTPKSVRTVSAVYDDESVSRASEFLVPDELSPEIARLVNNDIVPKLASEEYHSCLGVGFHYHGEGGWRFENVYKVAGVKFQLFAGSAEPRAFAGCFERSGGTAQAWLLPLATLDIGAWVQVALKQWHKLDPERFPANLGWERSIKWMAPSETGLVERIEAIQGERRALLARLDSTERELGVQLHTASLDVDANERRLLTAQGASLVDAVAKAFEELGFRVQDMDAVLPARDKREDLRVSPPDREDWTAICEVKGYHKGAGVNDLQKLERFRGRFYKEKARDPDRCWYVANTFLKDDPSQRAKPLATNPVEVETFAEVGGLVLGTPDLFQLVMDVRRGKLEVQEARRLLMEQTGFFSRTADGQVTPKAG